MNEQYVCPECGYPIIEAPADCIDAVIKEVGLDTRFTCTGCGMEAAVRELLKINYSWQPLEIDLVPNKDFKDGWEKPT